jgi:hypothetical protein
MSRKQILFLFLILAFLSTGLWARFFLDHRQGRDVTGVDEKLLAFDPGKAERILIGKGLKTQVEIFKEDGIWKVKELWNARADEIKVQAILSALSGIQGDLRSSDPALFQDFGITDPEAFCVKVTGGNNDLLADLKIGIKSPGPTGFFIRLFDRPDVYDVEVGLDRMLGLFTGLEEGDLSSGFWADLALLKLKPERVKEITISRLKDGVTALRAGVVKEEGGEPEEPGRWKLVGPQESLSADPDKVLRFIVTLNSLRAQAVANPNQKHGLDHPVWQLVVKESEGEKEKEMVLFAGAKDSKEYVYFVKRRDQSEVYRLNGYYFEDMNITNEKLIGDTPQGNEETGNS